MLGGTQNQVLAENAKKNDMANLKITVQRKLFWGTFWLVLNYLSSCCHVFYFQNIHII